jgi:hypothetical protein
MDLPLLSLFTINRTSSLLRTRALSAVLSVLKRVAASATLMGAATGPLFTETETPRSFVLASVFASGAASVFTEPGPESVTVVVVMVVMGTVSPEFAGTGLAEIPARPASLIPAAGAGLGNDAFGVTRMGPPNGPL